MHKSDDLTTFIVPKVVKIRSLNLLEPFGPPWPIVGHLYHLPLTVIVYSGDLYQETGVLRCNLDCSELLVDH
jgi:hypothetical protein